MMQRYLKTTGSLIPTNTTRLLLWMIPVLFASLVSCRQKSASANDIDTDASEKNITEIISFSSFKRTDKVMLSQTGQNGFFSNMAIVDTFLVCTDYRSPLTLQVFGIPSHQPLGKLITRGDQRGQCLGIANILPAQEQNIFWVYDITLGKFLKIDLKKALQNPEYTGEEEIILTDSTKRAKSPCLVNDSLFAAGSYSRDDCRFVSFNKRSDILKKTGTLPRRHPDWPEENEHGKFSILASVYASNLVKHPLRDLFVAAYNKTDRLEFYDQGVLKKIIKGPDVFEPLVSFTNEGGEIMATETDNTRFSYTSICTGPNYIYTLYSGKNKYNTCSQKILVYDWNGQPVKIIEFDKPICYFTVKETREETIIYTLEKDTGNLCVAKL